MGNSESKQNNVINTKNGQPVKNQNNKNAAITKKKQALNKTNAAARTSTNSKKSPPAKDTYQPATTYKFGSSFVPIQNPQNNGGNVVAHTRFENAPPPRHEFHQTIKKQTLVASKMRVLKNGPHILRVSKWEKKFESKNRVSPQNNF